jgi:hypothetical protein
MAGTTHGERLGARSTRSVPASTSIDQLVTTTVGEGSRLGRKNRAKDGKMNGTPDNDENVDVQ